MTVRMRMRTRRPPRIPPSRNLSLRWTSLSTIWRDEERTKDWRKERRVRKEQYLKVLWRALKSNTWIHRKRFLTRLVFISRLFLLAIPLISHLLSIPEIPNLPSLLPFDPWTTQPSLLGLFLALNYPNFHPCYLSIPELGNLPSFLFHLWTSQPSLLALSISLLPKLPSLLSFHPWTS